MTWVMTAIAGVSAAANIGINASKASGGGSNTTAGVMGGVNGLLSGLMGSGLGGSEGQTMAPDVNLAQTQIPSETQGFAPPPPPAYQPPGGVPGTSPWSQTATPGITGPGGYQPTSEALPLSPGSSPWNYQQMASMAPGMAPSGMSGGGTAAGPYTPPPAPGSITPPTPPNPYASAIAGAAPALSNVLAARIAQQRPQVLTQRTYNVPASTAPVTIDKNLQPPARLSPLDRYRMMLSGMR